VGHSEDSPEHVRRERAVGAAVNNVVPGAHNSGSGPLQAMDEARPVHGSNEACPKSMPRARMVLKRGGVGWPGPQGRELSG
jgi:hypothetical protein